MKTRNRSGFTIMEVSLFLALSGFLMVGLIASANMSVNRQRYSDSVNSVSDFLRGIYTDVLNVSNDKTPSSMLNGEDAGRTTTAIYGKLLIFGEQKYDMLPYLYMVKHSTFYVSCLPIVYNKL